MKDIILTDQQNKIAELLLNGKTPREICSTLKCNKSSVSRVQSSDKFATHCLQVVENISKISAFAAVQNIVEIANNGKVSDATRLKANTYLVDKALEFKDVKGNSDSPSNMSQDQLIRELKELQDERVRRAKPVEDIDNKPSIDDMLD